MESASGIRGTKPERLFKFHIMENYVTNYINLLKAMDTCFMIVFSENRGEIIS